MKSTLLLIVISSFAFGIVGCKGAETPEATTTAASGAGAAGNQAATANPAKAGGPQVGTAPTPQLSATANDPNWKPGSAIKGGGK